MKAALRVFFVASVVVVAALPADTRARAPASLGSESRPGEITTKTLRFGDSRLVVAFAPGDFKLTERDIVDWVLRSARATATYFGRFPVTEARISLEAAEGEEVSEGEAWAARTARIRVLVGRNTTPATLKADSTMVHEMAHLAFPDLDEKHLWLHEGIATYVETVALAQAREIGPAAVWAHFVEEMPQGLPASGDAGIDDTPSYDRRYWGGAMFCLVADVEIRRRTDNRFGLKDALRAILSAGGTLAETWHIERALGVGDRAVGVPVLMELYASWKDRSVAPDLEALWRQLGVRKSGDEVQLVDSAPLAAVREAITAMPEHPLLLTGPSLVRDAAVRR